ncbi:class A beta-lactamase [Diaphorobacter sp. HDW4A]|uniref:class A beta-lactamase n=1 Tax=Diaphorobacter sp. HDW4A TaxID=2714924 RepID=UPI001407E423|nr:class A beta-lactamase [Diaphorobacter sp. HDW4A]QIL78532.1 class A beta-lactamase [Diaphorobacter sp. HDW4A]
MHRRQFHLRAISALSACAAAALPLAACSTSQPKSPSGPYADIEAQSTGRLGVAVLDTASGHWDGQRLDERFPMCSTFKWLAAAHVLQRVDQGREQLERRIRFGRDALIEYSPVTESQAGKNGMTLAELCHAAITVSDNTAANLILDTLGGPQGLTAFARSLGDDVTRLDRWEPALNESKPGDPRDTTSPRAMATLLQQLVLGDALSSGSREQLTRWLQATTTNRGRLAADLPTGWKIGTKTGSSGNGSVNDVGVFWPPHRPPIIAAVYITAGKGSSKSIEPAIATVARRITRGA